jgi:hypothetical protein
MNGRLKQRRRCVRPSTNGTRYCTIHQQTRSGVVAVEGGWCVWCGEPAVRFELEGGAGPSVALCGRHARALAAEIQTVLALEDRRTS